MTDPATLRAQALARLVRKRDVGHEPAAPGTQLPRILHELQVHQIELELQNEELQRGQRALAAAQQAVAESEQRFRDLYEQAPMAFLSLDRSGRVADANPEAARLLGLPAADLAGRKLSEFVAPHDQDTYHLHRRACMEGRAAPPAQVSLVSANATSHVAHLVVRARWNEGEPTELRVALLDATEQARAQLERAEAERLRQLMADALPVAVSYVRADGHYEFCNRTFEIWHGLRAGSAPGRPIFEVMSPDCYRTLRDALREGLAGHMGRYEGEVRFAGVGTRFVSVHYAPDRGADGAVHGCYELVDDRTQLEVTRRELRIAAAQATAAEERERRGLAADLHDGAAQLLSLASIKLRTLQDGGAPATAAALGEVLELVQEAASGIRSLSFELSPPLLYDLGFVEAAEWLAERLRERYGLRVTIEPRAALPPLDATARATLFRALRELLVNVAKHAGTQRARVVLEGDDDRARMVVSDEGVGFDTRARSGRFGLLHVVDRIGSLGGRVDVDSAPGRGTRVTVLLPGRSQDPS